ncbi:hypothetical protein BN978_04117 [Mycolicibacterium mageritense DSM 44476 = CIP 104973]|nr:hypothetical protein BN978_04117 [Mycolicibacterium mageritense DSM 44476 = CIP 104973]
MASATTAALVGAQLDGLAITGAPAASANAAFLATTKLGAFHGAITATGPHGRYRRCTGRPASAGS